MQKACTIVMRDFAPDWQDSNEIKKNGKVDKNDRV